MTFPLPQNLSANRQTIRCVWLRSFWGRGQGRGTSTAILPLTLPSPRPFVSQFQYAGNDLCRTGGERGQEKRA